MRPPSIGEHRWIFLLGVLAIAVLLVNGQDWTKAIQALKNSLGKRQLIQAMVITETAAPS